MVDKTDVSQIQAFAGKVIDNVEQVIVGKRAAVELTVMGLLSQGHLLIEDVPGVLGYFQVDSGGEFSTPLLPPEGAEAASLGIGEDEFDKRLHLARELQAVLADNRLVHARAEIGPREQPRSSLDAPNAATQEDKEAESTGAEVEGLKRIRALPRVLSAAMVYHYFEDEDEVLAGTPPELDDVETSNNNRVPPFLVQ